MGWMAGVPLKSRLLSGLALIVLLAAGQAVRIPIEKGIVVEAAGGGSCRILVRVDESADILLSEDRLTLRTISGKDAADAGTVCSDALPDAPLGSFRMEVVRGRGRVLLVENPSGRNGHQAWIRVDDRATGESEYEMQIVWGLEEGWRGEGGQDELVLRPRGVPVRWASQDGQDSASDLPGGRLTSFENDALRYDSNRSGQLEFRGRVDDIAEFHIRGDRLNADVKQGQLVKVERFRFSQPLPGVPTATVSIEKRDGRGTVEIVQRPEATNRYTAVIRVSDPQGGSDRYHWILNWSR